MRRAKFSLVELLIVIAIIAILAAMLLPVLKNAKDMAIQIKCSGILKQAGLGFVFYLDDYHRYPTLWNNADNASAVGAVAWYDQFKPYGIDSVGSYYFSAENYPMACPSWSRVGPAGSWSCYGYNFYFADNSRVDKYSGCSNLLLLADCDNQQAVSAERVSNNWATQAMLIKTRHSSNRTANVLFADYHVDSIKSPDIPYLDANEFWTPKD